MKILNFTDYTNTDLKKNKFYKEFIKYNSNVKRTYLVICHYKTPYKHVSNKTRHNNIP